MWITRNTYSNIKIHFLNSSCQKEWSRYRCFSQKNHHILIFCFEKDKETWIFQKFQVFIDTFCEVMLY